jgi:hypothetical protein
MPSPRIFVALTAGALVLAATARARAGTFTAEGAFLFDPNAAIALDFEGPAKDGEPARSEDPAALHGKSVVELEPFKMADFAVGLPETRRAYRASAWIKGHEAWLSLRISYSDRASELATLYPTGRVTSDGWVEVENRGIRVDGARLKAATISAYSEAGAVLDAVEIVPDGDDSVFPGVPNAKCDGAAKSGVCAADQVCVFSECRNMSGQVPPIPEDRDLITDYLESRMTLLFGPFQQRATALSSSLVAIDRMRHATTPWEYWNGFLLAIRRLHDGQTQTSGAADLVMESPRPIAVCFIEGDADLTHAGAPKDPDYLDVLVSHTGQDHTLGLAPGDRLLRVDGMHPIAWARSLIEVHSSLPTVSNPRTFAELASSMSQLISRYAGEIEVIRCDAAAGTCGSPETISIKDLPEDPPGTPFGAVRCDSRPLRHLPDSPASHDAEASEVFSGIALESDAVEKIYGLEWESLFTTSGLDGAGPGLSQAVSTWKSQGARGVILDHRKGVGGTAKGAQILWEYAVSKHPILHQEDRQRAEDEQPTAEQGKAIFDAAEAAGLALFAGSESPVASVPVALLVTEDLSASDLLPLGMKGAPNVRIFGPFETNGAFSTRCSFGYWLGMSYTMAAGDAYLPDGATASGTGVLPDVIVLPTQSDLLAGKDTVYEAALAWVRSELQ